MAERYIQKEVLAPEPRGQELGLYKGPSASGRRRTTSDGRAAIRLIAGATALAAKPGPQRVPQIQLWRFLGGDCSGVHMFEPLGDTEKKTGGRTMKIIWIVLAVAAVILAVISFA